MKDINIMIDIITVLINAWTTRYLEATTYSLHYFRVIELNQWFRPKHILIFKNALKDNIVMNRKISQYN